MGVWLQVRMADDTRDSDSERTVYKVQLPWCWKWTGDYETAFQLATGLTTDEADGSHKKEHRITAFGASAREVECVCCGKEMSESRIGEHHADEHPRERYDPVYYTGAA